MQIPTFPALPCPACHAHDAYVCDRLPALTAVLQMLHYVAATRHTITYIPGTTYEGRVYYIGRVLEQKLQQSNAPNREPLTCVYDVRTKTCTMRSSCVNREHRGSDTTRPTVNTRTKCSCCTWYPIFEWNLNDKLLPPHVLWPFRGEIGICALV